MRDSMDGLANKLIRKKATSKMHENVQTKKQFLDLALDKWNFQVQNFRPSQGAVLGFHFCEFDTAMNMCKFEDIFNFSCLPMTFTKI